MDPSRKALQYVEYLGYSPRCGLGLSATVEKIVSAVRYWEELPLGLYRYYRSRCSPCHSFLPLYHRASNCIRLPRNSCGRRDQYILREYPEQETPNKSQDSGLIRVTHPHHPLYNQVIKVLRRAGNLAYPEPCYLIELPDQTRAELPCSWAIPAVPGEYSLLCSTPAPELWAGVVEYLALAHLVQAILAPAMEEKANERLSFDCTSKPARTEQSSATLGTVPGGTRSPHGQAETESVWLFSLNRGRQSILPNPQLRLNSP